MILYLFITDSIEEVYGPVIVYAKRLFSRNNWNIASKTLILYLFITDSIEEVYGPVIVYAKRLFSRNNWNIVSKTFFINCAG